MKLLTRLPIVVFAAAGLIFASAPPASASPQPEAFSAAKAKKKAKKPSDGASPSRTRGMNTAPRDHSSPTVPNRRP